MRRSARPRLALYPLARKAARILGAPDLPAMRDMDPPDPGQQGAIGRLARTISPAAPGIKSCRRDAHHIAHDANLEGIALIFDKTEFHRGASGKMRRVFFRISRSM